MSSLRRCPSPVEPALPESLSVITAPAAGAAAMDAVEVEAVHSHLLAAECFYRWHHSPKGVRKKVRAAVLLHRGVPGNL